MSFSPSHITPDYILADTPDGQPVAIDFKALVGKHILIAATSGGGKSVVVRKTVELTVAAGMQAFVFDSDGTFPTLREAPQRHPRRGRRAWRSRCLDPGSSSSTCPSSSRCALRWSSISPRSM